MFVAGPGRLLLGLLLLLLPLLRGASGAWDPDLELLDLVEEVPQSFYQLLSVDQAAGAVEIKKAYRRLSLVLHPDKNKEPDAEDRFRQLVAVYEVLKDEERRKRYDEILEHGLPDWRQPVFYYRRVRRMSNSELFLLLFIIFTVGHYAVLWSIYLEKILDDLLSRKKREKKKKTSKETDRDDRDDRAQERPHWQDLLPLKLSMWLYVSLRNLPQTVQELKSFYEEQQLKKKRLEEEQEPQTSLVKLSELKAPPPVTSLPADDDITQREGMACDEEGEELLVRRRNQAKVRGRRQADFDPEEQDEEEPSPDPAPSGPAPWTQNQQRLLELALQQFPRGTPERWTRIAAVVPGKTKDECMSRYKTLAELVQKRKQAKTS